jgi:hypothetical protein
MQWTWTPRRIRASLTALFVVAVAAACSSSSMPGEIPGCIPVDGGKCSVSTGSGGSSGGSGADSGVCAAYADASACDACAASSCCSELTTCLDDTACANLDSCETSCDGTTACITACQNQYPTGVSDLTLLFDCLSDRCTVCAQSGVGDPCRAPFPPCATGLTCNGDWCTETCVHSSQCTGFGTNGENGLGETNSCMITSSGYFCAPGCAVSPSDCDDFPGTYCVSTTTADNPPATVSVCAFLPDASVGN